MTSTIFNQIYLDSFNHEILIDWAIHQLEQDLSSEHLLMLASLSYRTNKEEILDTFYKALSELDIEIPDHQLDNTSNLIEYQVVAMNARYQSPRQTLRSLVRHCIDRSYPDELLPYHAIDDQIDVYLHENPRIFYIQTKSHSLEDWIRTRINEEWIKQKSSAL